MHIAIDARMYGTAQRGIGRYLMKLIEYLEIVESTPPLTPPRKGGENCYTIFLRKENFDEYQPKTLRFKKMVWDAPWYGLREQLTTSYVLRTNPDIVHFPHWNVPLFFNRPFIVTIHDLELFSSNRTRENTTRGRLVYALKHLAFNIVFRHAVLAAHAIIVPSNVVREKLLDQYPQVRQKVHVIYEAPTIQGLGTRVLGTSALPNAKPYPLIPSPYVLYVGAAYPHKNLPRLLEAWQIVHKELPEYRLVLVGRPDFFWERLKAELFHAQSSALFLGETTDAELAALYQNAALLVQPSLEEGFSLPPLEALSFGCPVAVSDIPVHREILQNAALFFDPYAPSLIAQVIQAGLSNEPKCTQALHHAPALLSRYSWNTHAQATLQLYEHTYIE